MNRRKFIQSAAMIASGICLADCERTVEPEITGEVKRLIDSGQFDLGAYEYNAPAPPPEVKAQVKGLLDEALTLAGSTMWTVALLSEVVEERRS